MDADVPPPHDHAKWETQAMGHVVGGLEPEASSAFRRHLLGCSRCKAHVQELRDLAGTLQIAAREEQSVQAIRLAARTASDDDDDGSREPVTISGRLLAVIVVVALVVGILVFSNLSQRARTAASQARASEQASTLAALGSGLVISDVAMSGQVSGVVVSDGHRIGWSLSGLPHATETQWLAVWLVTDDGGELVSSHGPGDGAPGLLSGSVNDRAADRLVVTLASTDQLVTPVPGGLPVPGVEQVVADLSLVRANETATGAPTPGSDAASGNGSGDDTDGG